MSTRTSGVCNWNFGHEIFGPGPKFSLKMLVRCENLGPDVLFKNWVCPDNFGPDAISA